MTSADPKGVFVDTIRTCYASWMRVPEYADPIRVRWYKIDRPPPGDYPITEYSSSDWDEDPKSSDPDLGEQSTLREPFKDWRDCSKPEDWCANYTACSALQTPGYVIYSTVMKGWGGSVATNALLNGLHFLDVGGSGGCGWRFFLQDGPQLLYEFAFWAILVDRPRFLVTHTDPSGNYDWQVEYTVPEFYDATESITFTDPVLNYGDPALVAFPDAITITGFGCRPLKTESGRGLLTESGANLITEC